MAKNAGDGRKELCEERLIAIGDIHGCSTALAAILRAIDPQPSDTIVALGDYIDRGLDSCGTLEILLDLQFRCRLVPLLGNHECMMLAARDAHGHLEAWIDMGGRETLESYGPNSTIVDVPDEHFQFLRNCRLYFETRTHFFVHASYDPTRSLAAMGRTTLLWESLTDPPPSPHVSGQVAVVGHTPQPNGIVLCLPHLICLDTGCVNGGLLSAMDLKNGTLWQSDQVGTVSHSTSM